MWQPGHNAKYLTYSFIDKETGKIVVMSLIQVSEVDHSNQTEKKGFIKTLQMFQDEKKELGINHQFDIWNFVKNINKKLINGSQKASCKILSKWVKSIGNHLRWACITSECDVELLREKWISVLFHIQDKHEWTGHNKFTKCAHQKLTKKQINAKKWISPKSDAFEVLQSIVFCKNTLKDLAHLTQFCHTGVLEVYHALYNKWAPKRQHFSYVGMLTKSQLAVVDFNEGISLEQATTEQGDKRFNVTFFKVTKQWSVKPIKEKKDLGYLHRMAKETIKSAAKNEKFNDLVIPKLPKNIAGLPNPDKAFVIENQKSRFGK